MKWVQFGLIRYKACIYKAANFSLSPDLTDLYAVSLHP